MSYSKVLVSTLDVTGHDLSVLRCLAIDGPTAVGKSVIGKALASTLNLRFCDTGLLYRAATLTVMRQKIDILDPEAIFQCVQTADIELTWETPETPKVIVANEDVTEHLRGPMIDGTVSKVAGLSKVRSVLVERQRSLARRQPIVMVGRDIGTFILPEARTKIFLDASLEERARRRYQDELNAGRDLEYVAVLDSISERDLADNTGHRAIHREQAASDAIVVDTDSLSISEVIERCAELYRLSNSD